MHSPVPNYGIRVDGTRFWVIHQKRLFGPFDYQFSFDLQGIEMLYQSRKFGECCSDEELCADLSDFHLPLKVAEVATVILGVSIRGIFCCQRADLRVDDMEAHLQQAGLGRYTQGLRKSA